MMRILKQGEKYSDSFKAFVSDKVLYAYDENRKVRLEQQATRVVEALGHTLEILIKKNLINKEDLAEILDIWNPDSFNVVDEE